MNINLFSRFSRYLILFTVVNIHQTAIADPAVGLHAGKDGSISQYLTFGQWLNRPVLYRVTFIDESSWNTISSPSFLNATRAWLSSNSSRVEVISVPLVPKDSHDNALNTIVAGQHDDVFRDLARRLASTGFQDRIILRLGWELNGSWFPWSAVKSPSTYAKAYRRVVILMRNEAPSLRFDWNVACTGKPDFDWVQAYPGNDVVDIISMDVYDQYIHSWNDILNHPYGLKKLRAFAHSQHKPEAYPEWSLSTSSHGRGDEPEFIERMHAWFNAPKSNVLYQAYWNTYAGGPDAAISGPDAGHVPKSASTYRLLFGSQK